MEMCITLSANRHVVLTGDAAEYWVPGATIPAYSGPIAGLPESVIGELLKLGAIRRR